MFQRGLELSKRLLGSNTDHSMAPPTDPRKRQNKDNDVQQARLPVSRRNPDNPRSKPHDVAREGLAHDKRQIVTPPHGATKKKGDKGATKSHEHKGKVTTSSSRETEGKRKALHDVGRAKTHDHSSSASRSQKSTKEALKARIAKERELKDLTDDLAGTVELYHDMREAFASKLLSGQISSSKRLACKWSLWLRWLG